MGSQSNALGQRIEKARIARGLKQVQLAELSGLGQGHLSQIEHGEKIPSLATLKKLRDALALSESEWVTWVDAA